MKRNWWRLCALLTAICLAGCDLPSDAEARAEFLKLRPEAQILRCAPGEGNSNSVYFLIKYRLTDTTTHDATMLFVNHRGRRDFTIIGDTWKGIPNLPQ